jgi:hypothetical protein
MRTQRARSKMHKHFRELTQTLDYLEVCKVTCKPDGTFAIPSEKEGRVALLSHETRLALSTYLRSFAERLLQPDPSLTEQLKQSLAAGK